MSDQRVKHPFWDNARQKTIQNESCTMPHDKQRDDEVLKGNTGPGTSNTTSASGQPFTNIQGGEAKRQKILFTTDKPSASQTQTSQPSDIPLFKTTVDVGRRWQFAKGNERRHHSRSVSFTVISYNVLADFLLQAHPALYDECDHWLLQWEYRKKNLIKEILHYNADILCLQEVQEQHYIDWFEPELSKAGYHGLYKKRTGDKVDGCAIFYRASKFAFITVRNLNFRIDNVQLMDRDNVAMLTLLHPKYKDGSICNYTALCIVNTHLLFNKKRGDIKLLQLVSLFAEIDKLKKEFIADGEQGQSTNKIKLIPVVLCGDFNMTPFCPLYHYISNGTLNYNNLNKKELSGQSKVNSHRYSFGDILKSNIIPREMGLTNTSLWDVVEEPNASRVVDISLRSNNDGEWPALRSSESTSPSGTGNYDHRSASFRQSKPYSQAYNTCESARQSNFQERSSSSSQYSNSRQSNAFQERQRISDHRDGVRQQSNPRERSDRWDQKDNSRRATVFNESQRPSSSHHQSETRHQSNFHQQSHVRQGFASQEVPRTSNQQSGGRHHNDPREIPTRWGRQSNARQDIASQEITKPSSHHSDSRHYNEPRERPTRRDRQSNARKDVASQELTKPSSHHSDARHHDAQEGHDKRDRQSNARQGIASQEMSRPSHHQSNTRQQHFQERASTSSQHSNARQVIAPQQRTIEHRHYNSQQRVSTFTHHRTVRQVDQAGESQSNQYRKSTQSNDHQDMRNTSNQCEEVCQSRYYFERRSTSIERNEEIVSQAVLSTSSQGSETIQELPKPIQYDPNCTSIHHQLYLWSVYRHFLQDNQREVTTYHGKTEPSCTVDYIFASTGRNEMCSRCRQHHSIMELTGTLKLLSDEDVTLLGGLPSAVLSSDHLALVASFALHL